MPTREEAEKWKYNRDALHLRGQGFFGWGHKCVDEPRLMVLDKYYRKDRSTERTYRVDGEKVFKTFAEALEYLSGPLSISAEEQKELDALPEDGSWLPFGGNWLVYYPLASKGLCEIKVSEDGSKTVRRRL